LKFNITIDGIYFLFLRSNKDPSIQRLPLSQFKLRSLRWENRFC